MTGVTLISLFCDRNVYSNNLGLMTHLSAENSFAPQSQKPHEIRNAPVVPSNR